MFTHSKLKTKRIGLFYLCSIILTTHFLTGCKKNDDSELDTDYTVYTAGQFYDNGWKACYWKGTSRTVINGELVSAMVTSLFVSDGKVYTSGYYNLGTIIDKPCYWEDSKRIDLKGDGTHQAYTSAIFVSDGIVYTAGRYYNGSKMIPCYWENTTRKDITDYPGSSASISGIFVSNGDVYLSGAYSIPNSSPSSYISCYWKNGKRTDMPTLNSNSSSIFVSNDKVYIGGGYTPEGSLGFVNIPCFWEETKKTDVAQDGVITSIFVYDGMVYTAGEDGKSPCFWKGTTKTTLSGIYRANSIYVKDGRVFTAGYYINEGDSRRPHIPCYWVGTKRVDLPVTGDLSDSRANNAVSIFVE